MIKILKQDGPWGSYGSGPNKKSGNGKSTEENIDDMINQGKEIFRKWFDNRGRNSSGGKKDNNSAAKKSLIGIVILAVITLWLSSGIFKVGPDENGLVLLFGKFNKISTPGLGYHIPKPFGKVIKKSVIKVNTEAFTSVPTLQNQNNRRRGFFGQRNRQSVDRVESLMLTGDENIVDIDFQVQWQISDIKDFIFNLRDPILTIRKASQSAMREIIAKTPIANALSDGKMNIEQRVKTLLQETLDSYKTGVRITLVQLQRVDPPKQVIDSFRDVQTAKADKEKRINQAEAYRNDIIPKARGISEEFIQTAEGYKKEVIANAQGQAKRFLSVYNQYKKAKIVTKRRIYLETMEKIYEHTNKIIIDKNISKSGMVPYLPLNELNKK